LLDVIRDDLKLIGTKVGCNENLCGSCTVLIDGKPKNTCKLPVERAEGKHIVTIEGIGTRDHPDIIQKAFVNVGATQCGFCTPGMILTAKAILDENPDPTREEVKRSLKRNLCRCTGYKKIIDGVLLAAKARKDPELVREKDVSEFRLGGKIPQRNSWEKVTGSLQFAQDIYLKDMCHAKVLRSPHFHASVLSIDTSAAEALPDVVAVATAKDLKGPNRVKYIFQDFRVVADEKVRYLGEPVAVVVARTLQAAEEALGKIEVTYEELPAVTNVFDAMKAGAPEVQEEDYPGNELFAQNLEHGDVETGFEQADIIEENIFTTPANAHGYLEPDTGVAFIDDEGRVAIYACGQAPHYHRDEVARVLGLGEDEVRVVEDGTGGGFGARIDPFIQLLLGLAVYKAKVPVKLQFTAEEHFIGNCKRHPFWIKFKTGVQRDGKIVAHQGEIITDAGAYALASPVCSCGPSCTPTGPMRFPTSEWPARPC